MDTTFPPRAITMHQIQTRACSAQAMLDATEPPGAAAGTPLSDDGHATQGDPAGATGEVAHGTPASETLSDYQLAEWQRRQDLVAACIAARVGERGGSTLRDMERGLSEPLANLSRYLAAFRAGGPEALRPEVAPGRKPKFELTRDEALALRRHHLERGSLALAVEWFARDPRCLPATRSAILETLDRAARERREPRWPQSLRRAGHVTAEEKASFRGPKAMMDLESCDRRGLWYVDETGERRELLPGALWESDDMSSNEPFRYTDPESGATQLGRQMLFTLDVASSAYLGFTPIGRVRDAYRVEDIADHMLALVDAHGLPQAWRLERGVWENTFIDGVELADGTWWGGLEPLLRVLRTWKSRGKGAIESSFNLLQSLVAHGSTSIGRVRGEFEAGTRDFLRAQAGDAGAAQKFWDIAECADAYVQATEAFNHRPKKRRAHGRDLVVPADLFREAVRRECPAGERWRFFPVKRTATVRQGAVEMSVNHYPMPFRFRVNGASDLYLEHGYAVLVAFHPGKPELGCHVFNAETGTRNRDGFAFGERLLVAPMAGDAPQFSLTREEQDAFAMRRKAAAAVRTEFRAIVPGRAGGARVSVARDGRGNAVEMHGAAGGEEPSPVTSHRSPVTDAVSPALPAHTRRAPDYDALARELAEADAERERNTLPV